VSASQDRRRAARNPGLLNGLGATLLLAVIVPLALTAAQAPPPAVADTPADAVIASARRTAYAIEAACIATYTVSGVTSLRAARERPEMPIVGLTPSLATARRLTLAYGIRPVHTPEFGSIPDVVRAASEIAVAHDFARNGDPMVITAAVPLGAPGTTNVMRVAWVDDGGEG
jgi:pyruvate kinase